MPVLMATYPSPSAEGPLAEGFMGVHLRESSASTFLSSCTSNEGSNTLFLLLLACLLASNKPFGV